MSEPIKLLNVREVDKAKRQTNLDLMSKLGNKNTKLSARLQKVETRYNSNDMLLGRELTAQEKRQRNKEMINKHKQKKRNEEIKK